MKFSEIGKNIFENILFCQGFFYFSKNIFPISENFRKIRKIVKFSERLMRFLEFLEK